MSFSLLLVLAISVSLLLLSLFLSRGRVGFYLLTSSFIYLTSFSWIPLNWLAEQLIDSSLFTDDIHFEALWGATAFYACFVLFTGIACFGIKERPVPVFNKGISINVQYISFAFFFTAILAYIALNGMSFSAGNYGQRLSANAGNGIFMIFFFLFMPGSYILLMLKPNYYSLVKAGLLCFICGLLVYFTLGGSRNVLAGSILGVIILAQRLRLLSLRSIIIVVLLLILFINSLAFVRYGKDLDSDILALGFRYLIDSLSPYDSFNKIVQYYESGDATFKGFEYISAQFNSLIPRALWPEKPVVPMTNALFYTQAILGSKSEAIIISPTLLGGLFIMGGWNGVIIGCVFLCIMTVWCEKVLFSNKPFGVLLLYTLLPYAFFMVRESAELFVNKGIIKFCTFSLVLFFAIYMHQFINTISQKLQRLTVAPH